ncbi:15530_t:CDS:2 [Cetraspora pellucida]|uniref:15530_t:CDS:1 n=1 Tax=Cetraspora pellucida TaxID=1433469 RepID=A0A9N9HEH4_9GLOM|nr:15530_t:CDS:2 [Cetraspora pellucida]
MHLENNTYFSHRFILLLSQNQRNFYIKNSGFLNNISVIKDIIKILTKDILQHMIEKINQDYNIDDLQHDKAQLFEPKSLFDKPEKEIKYKEEVPMLTERFVQFYNKTVTSNNVNYHKLYQIHFLMNACHILLFFFHIHPFYDDNRHIGCSLMTLYLAHDSFLLLVFQQLDQKEYADTLYKA